MASRKNRIQKLQIRARSRGRSRGREPATLGQLVKFSPSKAVRLAPTADAMFRPAVSERNTGLGLDPPLSRATFRTPARRPAGRRGGQVPLPSLVSAYVDPWCESAPKVKYPDEYHGLTGTFAVRQVFPVSTNGTAGQLTDLNQVTVAPAAGSSLQLFTPDPANIIIQGVSGSKAAGPFTGANNVFYWPNGISFTNAPGSANAFGPSSGVIGQDLTASNLGSMRLLYSGARLTSGGVKFTSTLNFSTVSGTVHFAPVFVNMSRMTTTGGIPGGGTNQSAFEMLNGWQSALPANLQAMATLPGYTQWPLSAFESDEMLMIFKNVGEEARLFKPTVTPWGMDDNNTANPATRYGDANMPDNYGHLCCLMYIDGVTSSTGGALPAGSNIGEIEIALNYECQPQPDTAALSNTGTLANQSGAQFITPAAPHQPVLLAAMGNTAADVPVARVVDDAGVEENSFLQEVQRLFQSGLAIARSAGPVIDFLGMAMAALVV